MCSSTEGTITLDITINNEKTNKPERYHNIVFKILDTPYQMIIGRPDIIELELLYKLTKH